MSKRLVATRFLALAALATSPFRLSAEVLDLGDNGYNPGGFRNLAPGDDGVLHAQLDREIRRYR